MNISFYVDLEFYFFFPACLDLKIYDKITASLDHKFLKNNFRGKLMNSNLWPTGINIS